MIYSDRKAIIQYYVEVYVVLMYTRSYSTFRTQSVSEKFQNFSTLQFQKIKSYLIRLWICYCFKNFEIGCIQFGVSDKKMESGKSTR